LTINNPPAAEEKAEVVSIAKPTTFSLEKFKSKRAATVAQAQDFVRLHPDEEILGTVLCQCADQGSEARHASSDR
jgi:hypothetical protein